MHLTVYIVVHRNSFYILTRRIKYNILVTQYLVNCRNVSINNTKIYIFFKKIIFLFTWLFIFYNFILYYQIPNGIRTKLNN